MERKGRANEGEGHLFAWSQTTNAEFRLKAWFPDRAKKKRAIYASGQNIPKACISALTVYWAHQTRSIRTPIV